MTSQGGDNSLVQNLIAQMQMLSSQIAKLEEEAKVEQLDLGNGWVGLRQGNNIHLNKQDITGNDHSNWVEEAKVPDHWAPVDTVSQLVYTWHGSAKWADCCVTSDGTLFFW